MTKAEQIAEELVLEIRNAPKMQYLFEKKEIKSLALITVNHILEMLNVSKVESVETYRHKLYTEVKQILEK